MFRYDYESRRCIIPARKFYEWKKPESGQKRRKEKYDFSDPYYDSGVVMAVKADSGINSYEDLNGKVVAVKMGTEGAAYAETLAGTYNFELKYFDDSPLMYQEVLTGNAAACWKSDKMFVP